MTGRLVSARLVGRRRELDVLMDAVAHVRAAAGPLCVLVAGEAGVGKTRLVEEALSSLVTTDVRVLVGRCVELGGAGRPLAPLVDILRALAATTAPQELDDLLGIARTEFARLLPDLDPSALPSPLGGDLGAPARLFELLLGVLTRLAVDRPLVIVMEDLHWADRSTIDLLVFLVRTVPSPRVLLIGTYRSDELHRRHPLTAALSELARMRSVTVLPVDRLTRSETAEQLAVILGTPPPPALLDTVFRRSEGNPFLAEELLAIAQPGDPSTLTPSLRSLLLGRVDRQSDAVQQVLRAVAAAGRPVGHTLLQAVATATMIEFRAALREAVEDNLLVLLDQGPAYAFRHDLLREAVYDDTLPGERAELHMAYADVLEATPELAGDAWTAASDLAYHSYAGLDLARALPAAIEAARQSATAFAYAEAQRHLSRALEIWPRVPDAGRRSGLDHLALIERAVDASVSAGEWETAASLADAALAEVDAGTEPERAALLLAKRAFIRQELGRGDPMSDLRAAADLLPEDRPSRARAEVLNSLGMLFMHRGAVLRAAELAEQAVHAAQAVGATDLEVWALPTMALRGYDGNLDEVLPLLNDAIALGSSIGAHDAVLRAYTISSDLSEAFGRHEQAARDAAAGVELARAVGLSRAWGGVLLLNEAAPLLRLGRWGDAERLVAEALDLDLSPLWRAAALACAADVLAGRGRLDEAASQVEAAKRLLAGRVEPQIAMPLALVAAHVATAARDWASARTIVADALSDADLRDLRRYAWPLLWWGLRIEADAAQDARDKGLPDAVDAAPREKLRALAAELPADSPAFQGFRALALAEVARSVGTSALDAWSRCVAAWRTAAEPHPLAYALMRSAEAALAVGERQAATEALREASGIAAALGAAPLVAEAEALSRRGRLEPAPVADAGQQTVATLGLTSREVDVLRLLAAGRTNTQIGTELFISPKTVSVHVSNILAKLGVAGRVEAAGVAHRLGLTAAR